MVLPNRLYLVQTLVRVGETERADQALAELSDQRRCDNAHWRGGAAARPAERPRPDRGAHAGSGRFPTGNRPDWLAEAFLLDAIARDALGYDRGAAGAVGAE